jgi:hypothetical protein
MLAQAGVAGAAMAQVLSSLPVAPVWPSLDGCRQFAREIYLKKSAVYRRNAQCMSDNPPRIDWSLECSRSGTVRRTLSAWPQCEGAQEECALNQLESEARRCEREAANRDRGEDRLALARAFDARESKAISLHNAYTNAKNAFANPRAFASAWLDGKVRDRAMKGLAALEAGSPHASHDLQETYDYLFSKSLGQAEQVTSNPIIRSIQGDVAGRIKAEHQKTIEQMLSLSNSIEAIGLAPDGRNESHGARSRPGSSVHVGTAGSDCAILDTAQRTDLAIDHAEEFRALIERCRR